MAMTQNSEFHPALGTIETEYEEDDRGDFHPALGWGWDSKVNG